MASRRRSRGQAMVEFAILIPFLFSIVLGSVDFGRVFAQNAGILGAAREAVRQAIAYDTASASNLHFGQSSANDTYVLGIAHDELGIAAGDTTTLQLAPNGHENDCFTPASPPASSLFPTANDTGYVFVCWETTPASRPARVVVTIAWTVSLVTPFVESMVGKPHLHAIVEGTELTP
jgi:Flp pilus assembly protein TadG